MVRTEYINTIAIVFQSNGFCFCCLGINVMYWMTDDQHEEEKPLMNEDSLVMIKSNYVYKDGTMTKQP